MQKKLRKTMKSLWKDRALVVMTLPATIYLILFAFIPMTGVVLAFKKFDFSLGLYGSPWVGLKNFRMLFISSDMFWRLTRNTVGYFLLHTAIGLVCNVSLAIALNELVFKRSAKYMQSIMIMPTFISYIAVAYIVEALLSAKNGMITKALADAGMGRVNFYLEAGLWPLILTIVKIWKDTGYGSVLYLSVLTGIDQEIYDAAAIDGASGWKKIRYITVPLLVPMMTVMTVLPLSKVYADTDSTTGSTYMINAKTEKIDACLKFLGLLSTDEKLANLAAYGIEGKHYTLTDEGRVSLIADSGYAYPGVWIVCNVMAPTLMEGEAEDKKEQYDTFNANAEISCTAGFNFDKTNVEAEMTALNAVVEEYQILLERGFYDPETYLPEYQEKLESAGLETVLAEMQTQYDAWMTANAE